MLTEGKLYSSPAEQSYRLSIFQQNLEMIKAHNADSSKTWTMGLNQFADMTDEELKARYTVDNSQAFSAEGLGGSIEFETDSLQQTTIPASADHRIFAPTTILSQGRCGSCWAFATAMTAEIAYSRRIGKSVQFSPQQILSCSETVLQRTVGSCNGGIHLNAI